MPPPTASLVTVSGKGPMDRRTFLNLTASTAAGAALVHCSGTYQPLPGMFKAGWEPHQESIRPLTCAMCPAACGLRARLVDGRLVRISGNPEHPTNAGGGCRLGIAALQWQHHPDRLLVPRKGRAPHASATTWEEASAAVTAALKASSGKSVAMVGRTDTVRLQLWGRLMAGAGGRVVSAVPGNGMDQVMEMMTGAKIAPTADMLNSDLILTVGQDFLASGDSPLYMQRAFNRLKERRGSWIHIGPYLNSTAASANLWLPCRPGTEAWVLLALCYVLLKEEAEAVDFLSDSCTGFDKLSPLILANFSPKLAGIHAGTSESAILKAGQLLARAQRPVALCGHEATWARGGLLSGWATIALNALKGQVAKLGGLVSRGELPLAPLPGEPGMQAQSLWAFLREVQSGRLAPPDLLFLDDANPLFVLGEDPKIAQWAAAAKTVVSFETVPGETSSLADWTLPSATFLEEWTDVEQPPGVPFDAWLVSAPALPPRGQSRPVCELLLKWLPEVGRELPFPSVTALLAHKAEGLKAARRGSLFMEMEGLQQGANVENRGWWLGEAGQEIGLDQIAEKGGWADLNTASPNFNDLVVTEDRRMRLFPPPVESALSALTQTEGPAETTDTLLLFPFFSGPLNPNLSFAFPWTRSHAGILEHEEWEGWVALNPGTASVLGIADGQEITLPLKSGPVRIKAVHYAGVMPGVLAFPMGFGHRSFGRWSHGEPELIQAILPNTLHDLLDVPTPAGSEIQWRHDGA